MGVCGVPMVYKREEHLVKCKPPGRRQIGVKYLGNFYKLCSSGSRVKWHLSVKYDKPVVGLQCLIHMAGRGLVWPVLRPV